MDSSRKMIWLGMFIGSTAGGFIPLIWGDSLLSVSSVLWSAAGGIVGIWLGYRMSDY